MAHECLARAVAVSAQVQRMLASYQTLHRRVSRQAADGRGFDPRISQLPPTIMLVAVVQLKYSSG